MKFLVISLSTVFLLCNCATSQPNMNTAENLNGPNRAPASSQKSESGISLHGLPAKQLMAIVQKAKAVDASADPCTMGSCYQNGSISITCQYPNGPHRTADIRCSVAHATNTAGAVNVEGSQANQLIHWLESASAVEESADPCTAGSCYENGVIQTACQYPNGPNKHHQYNCDIAAVKASPDAGCASPGSKCVPPNPNN